MKTHLNSALAILLGALLPAALGAQQKLNVVATTPDLASIAQAIGGERVDVKALAKPTEDAHFVDAKPSLIVTLNRADVLIDGGAELELGWLPALLQSARNTKLANGAPGRIVASTGVKLLEVPTSFDRSKGDVHALGNPHFMTDPANARIVASTIADHLSQVDPAGAATYKANLGRFQSTLDAKLADWQRQLAPYKGEKIITYHRDFTYFAERFGFDVLDTLEPKPGIAPSPAHIAQVIGEMKTAKAKVILVQPFQNRKTAETVARQTDAAVLDAAQQPGAVAGTATYFDLVDHLVGAMAAAFKAKS